MVLLWAALLTAAVFQLPILPWTSTRSLGVAWEMWNRGQFAVPLHNGVPTPWVRPLLAWLIQGGWSVFGVGEVWPRVLQIGLGIGWLLLSAGLSHRWTSSAGGLPRAASWMLMALVAPALAVLLINEHLLTAICIVGALHALSAQPHWRRVTLALVAGLLAAGPIMLVFVGLPAMLGPWWSTQAREDTRRWYRRCRLAFAVALTGFLLWAGIAGALGGERYRYELMTLNQVLVLPDLAALKTRFLALVALGTFPWILWPGLWRALRRHWEAPDDGTRFLLAAAAPAVIVALFVPDMVLSSALVTGTLVYLAMLRYFVAPPEDKAVENHRTWIGPLLALLVLIALGWILFLPRVLARPDAPAWLAELGPWSSAIGCSFGLLAMALLVPFRSWRAQTCQIAAVSVLSIALMYGIVVRFFGFAFDIRPASAVLESASHSGQPMARVGRYRDEFHFYARLQRPVAEITDDDVVAWARANPAGLIVDYPRHGAEAARNAGALLVQPFLQNWLVIWPSHAFLRMAEDTTIAHAPASALQQPTARRYSSAPRATDGVSRSKPREISSRIATQDL